MARYENERKVKITAAAPESEVLCVVRGFGYAETHLAAVPARSVVVLCEDGKPEGYGAASPVAGICGSRMRSAQPFVLVEYIRASFYWPGFVAHMGQMVSCRHCVRGLDGWLAERQRAGAGAIDFDELFSG